MQTKKKKKKDNLDEMIDPIFRNINRLFVLSTKKVAIDPTKDTFDKHYVPLKEIEHFNTLIVNKPFFCHSTHWYRFDKKKQTQAFLNKLILYDN